MAQPFTVTVASVREYIAAADARHSATLEFAYSGIVPEGRRYISGMEIADAMGWAKADTRTKITTALMNLRPRDLYMARGACHDKNQWMNAAIPAMVDAMIDEFQGDDVLDEVAMTGRIPAGVVL